ncbi:MAG: tRNA uridine-5-carboxymethylaminomethyl(34) synthesis enzyme MnmG, partial [Thermomicrobiales bacterium]|nr:tRNA uridine-5-carboxymethylaminomethyl(34) synthesis enzyme MnmG [Thermomicrobiales bacterium]
SIGGPGKSHIVAEIDALGGEMARAADRTALQVRMLNTSKGPAVQALRIQADKSLYALAMKEALESEPNISVVQDEATGIVTRNESQRPEISGVTLRSMGTIDAQTVIVTAGTFLRGAMISGESRTAGARAGDSADTGLAGSMAGIGLKLRRLKTGTPPRIDARSVDFSLLDPQDGDEAPVWFSRDGRSGRIEPLTLPPLAIHKSATGERAWRPQLACWRLATNEAAHELIRDNVHRAPMFNGSIEGIGPRYCPSIEDKVYRFADKTSHPVFLEPEGWRTTELYVQGMSTSLPADVQEGVMRTIPSLANARITRYGYAVEYDAVDPNELLPTMESRAIGGLYLAGQINGTSGYEEAGGQGLLAGWNAANAVRGRDRVILGRDQAYIGVMVDDLVTRPFDEPYRMLTSRAEYRLHLRPATAETRLSKLAHRDGLISDTRMAEIESDATALADLAELLGRTRLNPISDRERLEAAGLVDVSRPLTAIDVLRRPGVSMVQVAQVLPDGERERVSALPLAVAERIEHDVKYASFLEREAREIARYATMEHRAIPTWLDYERVNGMRYEAIQKLKNMRPATIGQAGRLSGVTPGDIAALLVYLTRTGAA